jgi:hemerythrin
MALVQWNDTLSVKINEIDGQHKKLIKMINDLQDAMRAGKGKDTLGLILNELARYTSDHFSTEEKYFERFNYPETATHMNDHARFIRQVGAFKADFESGKIGLTIKLMDFLSDWLQHHIMSVDKQYSAFFNEKGLH